MAVDNQGNPFDVDVDTFFPTSIEVITEGPQGPPGPIGPSGASESTYEHVQSVPTDTWVINHNLGRRPLVSVFSVGGVEMWAEILHISVNQVQVFFDNPVAGFAVCS